MPPETVPPETGPPRSAPPRSAPPEPGGPVARVLVCDDEPDVRELFADYLRLRGFEPATAADAPGMRAALAKGGVDVVLLDINMPGEDGLTALRDLRGAGSTVPVLLLTSRAEVVDRVVGIEIGADDYLPKPVDLRELEARIKAVLRRAGLAAGRDPAVDGARWRFGKCWLDVAAATLVAEDGSDVPLTAMEFSLLKLFADNRGRVLNRDQILEGAHDRAWDPFDRSIDIRISRLRRKLEVNPGKPLAIRTVRGLGYIYDPK